MRALRFANDAEMTFFAHKNEKTVREKMSVCVIVRKKKMNAVGSLQNEIFGVQ